MTDDITINNKNFDDLKTGNIATYSPNSLLKDRFRGFLPVVVDVETAGFNAQTDALLQVAMCTIKIENQKLMPQTVLSANIRPFEGANLEKANLNFLNIDPFDESRNLQSERDAIIPMFKAISKEVKKQGCKRAILVGHNGNFDLSFIKAVTERLAYKRNPFHQFSIIDTVSLSALMYGQTVLHKACMVAGIDFDANHAHDAAYDTLKEAELFCAIFNRFHTFCGYPEQLLIDDEEITY